MQPGAIASLAVYFALMLGIGIYAWRKSTASSSEYLLSGRQLGPAVTALAAGASDMSGWLMLGLPGALYASGLVEAWIAIGLFIGALANWIIVAPRLREQTERFGDALTIPEFLGNRFNDKSHMLRLTASIVIIVFFALYSASGLVAGGKLFQSAFGADYQTGLWITASVVVAYVVLGGFLAVSLTDFVQGTIMAIALIVVPLMAWQGLPAGLSVGDTLRVIDPNMTSLFAGTTALGILSTAAWGLGYFGQPHIIVRFMAIRSVKDIPM
ncbi:MAG: sodium:proline symporter, partial [Sphingorhabdus sp.]|nr:sodium:proline symporter [Sphingorhabdus sp.]